MVNRINKSGSETARSQFQRVANNKTKVNFKIVSEKVNNRLLGLHQAHDADGNPLSWEAGADGTGKFDGTPSYIADDSGNMIYEEASITIFDGNIEESESQIQRYYGDPDLTAEEYSVSTFAHEGDHNTNQEAIDAIRERQEGGTNNFDVEKPAYKVTNDVLKEIKDNRD